MFCSFSMLVHLYLFRYWMKSKARKTDVYFLPIQLVEKVHAGLVVELATGRQAFEMS